MKYNGCNYRGITINGETSEWLAADQVVVIEEQIYLFTVKSRERLTSLELVEAVEAWHFNAGRTIPEAED